MTTFFGALLTRTRLLVLIAVVLSLTGMRMWSIMPRQEDPEFVTRWGTVSASFPGGDPESVERLIVEPIENALAEVDEIRSIESRAAQGFANVRIALKDSVGPGDLDRVWKEIEDAIGLIVGKFPEGTSKPHIERGLADLELVVLAITGSRDPLVLREAAHDIREVLLDVPQVARVKVIGDPGEEIVVAYDETTAAALGISRGQVASVLDDRDSTEPAGSVLSGERRATITPHTEFRSLEEIGATPLRLASGITVPLGSVARIEHGPERPTPEIMRLQGQRSVGLGIVAERSGNIVAFGVELRRRLEELRKDYAPLEIHEVTFQPDRVEDRITELARSLGSSMAIVGGLLFFFMGVRVGAVVTVIVPLVVFSSLAIFAIGGGVLHQMSVAALVIALGMLVDNAIVVVENIVARMEAHQTPRQAALGAVYELAVPLFTATGTTVAAFVPMLLSKGSVGEFTRAIPILVTAVLLVSYLYAILVTPAVASWVLRPKPRPGHRQLERLAAALTSLTIRHYRRVIVLVLGALVLVGALGTFVEKNFFPGSDRNQVLVSVELPDGSRIEAVDHAARVLEFAFINDPRVAHVATFVGRSAPHFYYNVPTIVRAPHFAQLLVTTTSKTHNDAIEAFGRSVARSELPGTSVVATSLEQGPGSPAPIVVRLRGNDLEALRRAAQAIGATLEQIEGTLCVRDNMSLGVPNVDILIDDAATAHYGVSRREIAEALYGTTLGYDVGMLQTEREPVPIRLRSLAGESTPIDSLGGIELVTSGGAFVPLAQLVHQHITWRPAQYLRRNGKRSVLVLSNLETGQPYSAVMSELRQALPRLDLPDSVAIEFGGEAQGAGDANAAMVAAMPIGVLMLVGFLMLEFNSFRRVFIVLTTVPLSAVGVIPGLLIGGQPFGFMSLLGVVALAGVVVNNAIVLLEVIEQRRGQGAAMAEALVYSVQARIRPIFLTTATTVAGLLPLAFSGAALWPPLAWAMVSGLLASTVLTLVLVPALYLALIRT